ncbi:MAG: site-specific DNA-methyltransferase, partial [Prevotella fusca]
MEMKKQALTSASHNDFTLEALKQIAPSAFTEVRGTDGELTEKVDFDVLRELLGDAIADADEETFGFQWVGKQDAKRAAAEPTRQTLRPVVEDSVDWDTTENLYIEGDNLEVLKLLQRGYIGKVKMIYIDPPYNTGNDFVYEDDFAMSGEEMDEAMGNLDEEG